QPPRALVSPARLNFAKNREHLRCGDFGYRPLADCWISKGKQPPFLGERHVSAPLPLKLPQNLFGDSPEGIAARFPQLFQPALCRGIDIVGEQSPGVVAFLTRVLQRHGRIDADGQRLLLSAEPVRQAPQLAAARLDQQMKAAAVRSLDRPIGRRGVAPPRVVELFGIVRTIPKKIPKNGAATNKPPRTAANEPMQQMR